MQSKAATVKEYIASLPPDRRAAIEAVRNVVRKNLDRTYEEGMQYGMIGWYVPYSVHPHGYHCDPSHPLPFAGLASQKHYMSVYLPIGYCGCLEDESDATADAKWFKAAWAKTGKALDMGKVCLRFKRVEDLALDVIGEAIPLRPAKKYLESYLAALAAMGKGPDGKKLKPGPGAKETAGVGPAPKRAPAKKAPAKKGAANKKSAKKR